MEELHLAVAATDNKNYIAPVNETDNVIFLPFNDEAALEEYFKKMAMKFLLLLLKAYKVLVELMLPM